MSFTQAALSWQAGRFGWDAEVPQDWPTFHGHRLRLSVHTRVLPDDSTPPPLSAGATELIDEILGHFEQVMADAAAEFTHWASRRNGQLGISDIENPHVWLDQEEIEAKRIEDAESMDCCPGLPWTLVVEFANAPDFGVHIQFSGVRHLETWAGD